MSWIDITSLIGVDKINNGIEIIFTNILKSQRHCACARAINRIGPGQLEAGPVEVEWMVVLKLDR